MNTVLKALLAIILAPIAFAAGVWLLAFLYYVVLR